MFGTRVHITSPQSPTDYNINDDCEIPLNIHIKDTFAIQLTESQSDLFEVRYQLKDKDGGEPKDQFTKWINDNELKYTSVTLSRTADSQPQEFVLVLSAGQGSGFNFELTGKYMAVVDYKLYIYSHINDI